MKNYMDDRVYCSLNIGISGIVLDEQQVKHLKTFFDIGDIIQVQVEGFKQSRKSTYAVLKFLGPQNPTNFIPPSSSVATQHH